MPWPCGVIDCGYVVISTNDCRTFRLASVIPVERAKHILITSDIESKRLFAKHLGGQTKFKRGQKPFRGGKSPFGGPCSRKPDFKPNKSFKLGQIWHRQLHS